MRVVFLGTGGTRYNLISQQRRTGGFVVEMGGLCLFVDPGPGALFHFATNRNSLSLKDPDAIIVSHPHIDHISDLQAMIELMSRATEHRRGTVFLPFKALKWRFLDDYHWQLVERVVFHPVNTSFKSLTLLSFPVQHGVEAYGFVLSDGKQCLGYSGDTRFFPELVERFKHCDVLILNTTIPKRLENVDHLTLKDVPQFLNNTNAKRIVLTHLSPFIKSFAFKDERVVVARDFAEVIYED